MSENLKIEVLISTMHQKDFSICDKMKISGNCIIINQTDFEGQQVSKDEAKQREIKFLSFNERGLSRSRNQAIKNSTGDICLIADDDLVYEENYIEIVKSAYEKFNDADIIIFDVNSMNTQRQGGKISNSVCKIGYLKSLKVASYRITFRRKPIVENGIIFDKFFGAGSIFNSGEENIFLFDCLKRNLKIYYVPQLIAKVSQETSTWFKGFDKQYFITKGALSKKLLNNLYLLFILQFAFRKYKRYNKETSFINAIRFMLEGKKQYTKTISNQ